MNIVYPIFEILEINYEVVLDNDFSLGLAANYWFVENAKVDYQIIPYFRFYPIERMRGYGVFIETNVAFMSITDKKYVGETATYKDETTFA